jgi:hypothetical protein
MVAHEIGGSAVRTGQSGTPNLVLDIGLRRPNTGQEPTKRGPSMRYRFRLKTLLGLVLGVALILAFYASFLRYPPWEKAGGMIGWSQSRIELRLGKPAVMVEGDVQDAHAQKIRPRPPGTYRTLVFHNLDGEFVVWLKAEDDGFFCFGSSWVEKRRYY